MLERFSNAVTALEASAKQQQVTAIQHCEGECLRCVVLGLQQGEFRIVLKQCMCVRWSRVASL
eukprot:7439-Heterococcus_DN1.PRE.1